MPACTRTRPGGAVDVEHAVQALEQQQAPVGERDVAEGVPRAGDAHALALRGGALQRGGELVDRAGPLDRRGPAALIAGPVAPPLGAAAGGRRGSRSRNRP